MIRVGKIDGDLHIIVAGIPESQKDELYKILWILVQNFDRRSDIDARMTEIRRIVSTI